MVVVVVVGEEDEEEPIGPMEAATENWVEEDFVVWDAVVDDRDGLISVTCPFTIQTPFPESQHALAKSPFPQHRLLSGQTVITISISCIGVPEASARTVINRKFMWIGMSECDENEVPT